MFEITFLFEVKSITPQTEQWFKRLRKLGQISKFTMSLKINFELEIKFKFFFIKKLQHEEY